MVDSIVEKYKRHRAEFPVWVLLSETEGSDLRLPQHHRRRHGSDNLENPILEKGGAALLSGSIVGK